MFHSAHSLRLGLPEAIATRWRDLPPARWTEGPVYDDPASHGTEPRRPRNSHGSG